MSEKSGVISRTTNILADLMRGATYDRQTLASAFGTTVAAADRYIRNLKRVPGVQVSREGRSLRIRFAASEAVPRPSHPTAVAACWASGLADVFVGSSYETGLRDALAYVTGRARRSDGFQCVDRKFILVSRGGEPSLPESAALLDDLVDAVLRSRIATIDYLHFDGSKETLRVQPLSMAIYDHQIYVIAKRPNGLRYPFRLSRVQAVDVSSDSFEYPSRTAYNPTELFRHSFGVFVTDDQPIVKVRVQLEDRWRVHAQTHRWHPTQSLEDGPGGLVVTLEVRECWELKAWILGFGSEAVVLDPPHLAKEIAQIARTIAHQYRPRGQRRPPQRAKPEERPQRANRRIPGANAG
jgi:predicted DNA-binding transcriptional regulator YafY